MTEEQCVFNTCNTQQQAMDIIRNELDKTFVKTCPCCEGGHRSIAGHGIFKILCRKCGLEMQSDINMNHVVSKWNRRAK